MNDDFEFNPITIAPAISLYEGIIQNPHEVIEFALTQDKWKESTIFSGNSENNAKTDKEYRDCKVLPIPYNLDSEVIWFVLSKVLHYAGRDYAKRWRVGPSYMEHAQILHYEAGTGHYNDHMDVLPTVPRVFSAVLYLNDVEEGGETYFKYFDLQVKPGAGNLIIFPAEYPYTHGSLPPISGDKFAAVTWYSRYNNSNHGHAH